MARQELKIKEKTQIEDVFQFNTDVSLHGWPFKNRLIRNMDLSNLKFKNTEVEDIDFELIRLEKIKISNTKFINVKFTQVVFDNAVFDNILFEHCDFLETDKNTTQFIHCQFNNCRFLTVKTTDSFFTQTTFNSSQLKYCTFYKSIFHNVSIIDSKFNAVVEESKIENFQFKNSKVIEASFSEISGKLLSFVDGEVIKSGFFSIKQFSGMSLSNVKNVESTVWRASTIAGLKIEDCAQFNDNKFIKSHVTNLQITSLPIVSFLYISKVQLTDFKLESCNIDSARIMQLKISGKSHFFNVIWDTVGFYQCEFTDLQITKNKFQSFLKIVESIFNNLKFQGVTYGKEIEYKHEKITYVNSDRFLP